jgi:hypothetical protein
MTDRAENATTLELIAVPTIQKRILVVRARQVMLDEDLADLYGVEPASSSSRSSETSSASQPASCSSWPRIMRAFVELRRAAGSYKAIENRLDELERETRARPAARPDLPSHPPAGLAAPAA